MFPVHRTITCCSEVCDAMCVALSIPALGSLVPKVHAQLVLLSDLIACGPQGCITASNAVRAPGQLLSSSDISQNLPS